MLRTLTQEIWPLMVVLAGAGGWLLRAWWAHTDKREERISMRESRAWQAADERAAAMERRIEELADEVRVAARLCSVTVGALHIFADELIASEPEHAALVRVSQFLRLSYPCSEETPPDMAMLIARLDKVKP